jgi:hypothetical protein
MGIAGKSMQMMWAVGATIVNFPSSFYGSV